MGTLQERKLIPERDEPEKGGRRITARTATTMENQEKKTRLGYQRRGGGKGKRLPKSTTLRRLPSVWA